MDRIEIRKGYCFKQSTIPIWKTTNKNDKIVANHHQKDTAESRHNKEHVESFILFQVTYYI